MSDENDGVIPESKIREAHAICMRDPNLAKYFEDAPQGARQYIALMFYCTVFHAEVDDEKCASYQAEVEAELTRDDLLYLATHERNPISKAHFRELYAATGSGQTTAEPVAEPEEGRLPNEEGASIVVDIEGVITELRRIRTQLATLNDRQAAYEKLRKAPVPIAPRWLASLTLFTIFCSCCIFIASAVTAVVWMCRCHWKF